MREANDAEYGQSAELLADCYKAVSFMPIGKEFTANDVCERLNRPVRANSVAKKLVRMKELEVSKLHNGALRFKKVAEVWY